MTQTHALQKTSNTPLLKDFPPLVRNRNFLLLWLAYVVSVLGDRIHFLVMLQLLCVVILKLKTYGAQQNAQLNLAMFLPFLLLAPLGGIVSDRLPRRWVMITCDLARVVIVIVARTVLLVAAYRGDLPVGELLLLLFGSELLLSSFGELFSPARAAILPNLVHPTELLQANSIISVVGTIFTLIGFVLGSLLIIWRLDYAMYADAATYILSATFVYSMRMAPGMDRPAPARRGPGLRAELNAAIKYLRGHVRPFQAILLELAFTTSSAVVLNCLPSIVTKQFHLPDKYFGWFMGIAGGGMILGAAAVSRARRGIPKEVGIGWATVMIGLGLVLGHFAPTWPVLLAALIVAAAFGAVMFISVDTLLQRLLPDYVRGRIMGARDLITTFGLLAPTVPLAIWPHIDAWIPRIILATGAAISLLGIWLLTLYYRRPSLPWGQAVGRRIIAVYLTLWHRWRLAGACRIPTTGPVIVAANHTSGLDPLALIIGSRRRLIRFMVAREYYQRPIVGRLCRWIGCIPVNRSAADATSVRAALRALRQEAVLGVFPEGGISADHTLRPGKPGIAMLALLSGAPVVPVYISGTRPCQSITRDFLQRATLVVHFGAPLRFGHLRHRRRDHATLQMVTDQIMQAIAAIKQRVDSAGGGS
jgi:1-acyl-sn-glycerol-3-phosphate acyltransferase